MSHLKYRLAAALISVGALGSSVAFADTSVCNFESDYDIHLQDQQRVALDNDDHHVLIDGEHLFINGQEQSLSPRQQELLQDYRQSMEAFVPELADVVTSAVTLGLNSASMAMAYLAGDDNPQPAALDAHFQALSDHIKQRFDGRSVTRGALDDDAFDAEIEAAVKETIATATGSTARLIATALLNPKAMEKRGDQVDAMVEQKIQPQADALEARGDKLCDSVRDMDQIEGQIGKFDVFREEPGNRSRSISM